MKLNKNIIGKPEEVEEALAKQVKAWAEVQRVGNLLHRHFAANDELRGKWIHRAEHFKNKFEAVSNATILDREEAIFSLVWFVYGINDAEGRVSSMLSNMAGGWVNPNGQAKASSVIYGSNVTMDSMAKAEGYLGRLG